ncbi:hypothetical protein [Streptomyces sp. NPDC057257]|uniref:hypothetical protein n=1 Tax=Streptomyces sp. NPDC057257 TaxID=3346071 RepID=UPI0036307553
MLLHRSSTLTPVGNDVTPAFWCEWRQADGRRISSARCPTPSSAIRWARIQIRIVTSAVRPDLVDRLVDRSYPGWGDAVAALEQGADFTLPVVAEPFSFVWHARRVLFVAVVDGKPLPHRPSPETPGA